MSAVFSQTETFSVTDVEKVMRRITADFVMIASSSRSITEGDAHEYAHDIELLAKWGCLKSADVTLLSDGKEVIATRFEVKESTGEMTMSRPGDVLWPQVYKPWLRVV